MPASAPPGELQTVDTREQHVTLRASLPEHARLVSVPWATDPAESPQIVPRGAASEITLTVRGSRIAIFNPVP